MPRSIYPLWDSLKSLSRDYSTYRKFIAIDTETTGTNFRQGAQAFAVSACNQDGKTFFLRLQVDPRTYRVRLKPRIISAWFESLDLCQYDRIVFHNAKFDIRAIRTLGITEHTHPEFRRLLSHADDTRLRDTLIYSHVLNSYEPHGLKELADMYLPPELNLGSCDELSLKDAVRRARRTQANVDTSRAVGADYWRVGDKLETYAINDAKRTALLYAAFCQLLTPELSRQVVREHLLLKTVFAMEETGIRLLRKSHAELLSTFTATALSSREKIAKLAKREFGLQDFNPASSQQLASVLHDKLKLPVIAYTQGGKPATGVAFLDEHHDFCSQKPEKYATALKFLDSIKSLRKSEKGNSYLKEYLDLSIEEIVAPSYREYLPSETSTIRTLHTSINQTGTDTTRCSSSGPNMQNVSTKEELPLRKVFGPRPGHFWVDADFENIELRIPAYVSGDKRLIEAFEQGISVHEIIAEELNGPKKKWATLNQADWKKSPEYKRTKNGNFALIYGASPRKADATYGVDGAYDLLCKRFSKLMQLMRKVISEAEKKNYVETLWGYRLYVPPRRAYCAFNYYVQGSAGDAMKNALLCADSDQEIWRNNGKLLLTVHDEMIVEFPRSGITREEEISHCLACADKVKHAMEEPGRNIGIPLTVAPEIVFKNWAAPTKQSALISQ